MRKFPNFAVIKRFYDRGNWTVDMVKVAVEKDFLTTDEFKQITGQDYVTDQPQNNTTGATEK